MRYLRTLRARLVLLCFLASSLLLVAFPQIDLVVSGLFFDNEFTLARQSWTRLLHEAVGVSIAVSMLAVVGIYAFNRFCKRNVCGIDGRKILYLFLVLILVAGLLVNATLEDNFGRVLRTSYTRHGLPVRSSRLSRRVHALPDEQSQIPLIVKSSVPSSVVERAEYGQPAVFDTVLDLFSIQSPGFDRAESFIKKASPAKVEPAGVFSGKLPVEPPGLTPAELAADVSNL